MRSLSKVASLALALAGLATAVIVGAAMAHMTSTGPLQDNAACGPPNKHVYVTGTTLVANGVPTPLQGWSNDKCLTGVPGDDAVTLSVLHCDATCDNHVYMTGGWVPKNYFFNGSKEEFRGPFLYSVKFGTGGPSGLGTSSLPDTLSSCFGLYKDGGAVDLNLASSTGNDSVMSTYVQRDPGTITLQIAHGGMQTCALTGTQQSFSELRVMVYPTTVAAVNDPSATGVGAVFFAKATLSGPQGQLLTFQGTSPSDWIVTQSGGKWTARPKPGLTKVISVPNADSAVVRVVGDARSAPNAPGQSPLILALIAAALLVTGVWVIRSRQTPIAA